MIHLENHNDDLNEHQVWDAKARGDLTRDEVEEFKSEFESLIADLKTELSSLEDNLELAVAELEEAIPVCSKCGEDLEDHESDEDGVCGDCEEDDDTEAEQEILWA